MATHVYAIIKGIAINNDGASKRGYASPSIDGQARVIASAQNEAGVDPESISYLEAHGTATPVGDPIEVAGFTQAFRLVPTRNSFVDWVRSSPTLAIWIPAPESPL